EHQELPFEQVVEVVQPPRRLDRTPIFQVLLAWQNNEAEEVELPGLTIEPVAVTVERAKFELELNLAEVEGKVVGALGYAAALFERQTVERYWGYTVAMLRAMAADDAQRVAQIDMLSDTERHQLVQEWNDTDAAYPNDRCIHELFEEQAEETPDAIAVA